MNRTVILALVFVAGCSSARVSWPSACNPSLGGPVYCKCKNLQYVKSDHPNKKPPAYKQTIVCDGEELPIVGYSE